MNRENILESIEDIQDKIDEKRFKGTNEHNLFLREAIADYIEGTDWVDYKTEKPTELGMYVVRIRQISMSGFREIMPKVVFSKNAGRFMGVGTDDIKVTHWFKIPNFEANK